MSYIPAIMDPAQLDRLYTGLNTQFLSLYGKSTKWSSKVCTVVNSDTAQMEYPIFANNVRMTEWNSGRVTNQMSLFTQIIKAKRYQASIECNRDFIRDALRNGSSMEALGLQIQELAYAADKFEDTLAGTLILSGAVSRCYDGQFFFDAAHPIDPAGTISGTQPNLHTAKPLNAANYDFVRSVRASRLGADGTPLNLASNVLIVPPQLEGEARRLLNGELIGASQLTANGGASSNIGAASNIWMNTAEIVVAPELASEPLNWYLGDLSSPMKPFLLQKNGAPEFTRQDSPEAECVYDRNANRYGVSCRYGAGFARWAQIDKALG